MEKGCRRFVLLMMALVASTKLLYVEPGK